MNFPSSSSPRRPALIALTSLAAIFAGAPAARAIISEPETLVYGRVLDRSNPNLDHLITAGDLLWTIRKPDGSIVALAGEIDELDGGKQSYLLRIPHQAVMLDQAPVDGVVPLGITGAEASYLSITVNGQPANIITPGTSVLDLDQLLRASALRLDLEVNAAVEDGDHDGMADWWEDAHGLDKQDPNDALTDLNGNGLNNLGEFLAGTDPDRDSTLPKLLTTEVIAYSESTSMVLLEVADSDSSPAQLVFTLGSLPEGGRLLLRDSLAGTATGDLELAVGATFTQADAAMGRLVFEHAVDATTGSFSLTVADEDPEHAADQGDVLIRLFAPATDGFAATAVESLRYESLRLAKTGHLVADLGATAGEHRLSAPTSGLDAAAYETHRAEFGDDLPQILLGGPSSDTLAGGHADDFLHGDSGADVLTGGPGADTFIYTGVSSSVDTILDFTPSENDRIDLAGLLAGGSTTLSDYVRIRRSGSDALVEVCAGGDNTGFSDLVIRLKDSPLDSADLAGLYYAGNLATGGIGMAPRIGIVAGNTQASENGPANGTFLITREGDRTEPLAVNLSILGNATNGVDYQSLPATAVIPAGEASVTLTIRPYVDTNYESGEVVRIELLSSAGYVLAANGSAELVIEDLKPQLSFEVFEGLASVEGQEPGSLLLHRGGLISSEIFVRFTIAGTALNGIDYQSVASSVTLGPNVTTKQVVITPKAAVAFGDAEAKIVRMTIKPDASYLVSGSPGEVLIVPRKLTYDMWALENGAPASSTEVTDEALMRYGFAPGPEQSPGYFDRLPKVTIDGGYLTLSFRRKPALTDLRYEVEYAGDFVNWQSGAGVVEDITSQVAPNDPGAAVFRAKEPMSARSSAGMRVRLVQP